MSPTPSLSATDERSEEVAEREGFEPSEEFPLHMISSHADSAWLSHLSDGGARRIRRL
jgi:hypothetical protein